MGMGMDTVLVEGPSDAIAVQVLAERLGLPAPRVLAVGGSKGVRRAAAALGGQRLVGLVDAAERRDFESVLDTVFVCDPDLEAEFVRALGVEGVEEVMAQQGELESFRRLQAQPFLRGKPVEHQLARFFGGRSGNKARYARFLAQAVDLDRIPPPLGDLLAALAAPVHAGEPVPGIDFEP
ncbi:ATP-dependent endonuclease [Paeniglutamicibacter sp. R2-26]|uniref:ATP-dependent endonuclease n=1 Tax=Paeniglutamicibacter sp. R2-26 TaxID=3144417 RepID=UPI003EE7C712